MNIGGKPARIHTLAPKHSGPLAGAGRAPRAQGGRPWWRVVNGVGTVKENLLSSRFCSDGPYAEQKRECHGNAAQATARSASDQIYELRISQNDRLANL